jgi:hypothetical protein
MDIHKPKQWHGFRKIPKEDRGSRHHGEDARAYFG